jgi:CO/xanthine dehydrogenase FAD-binding subunit
MTASSLLRDDVITQSLYSVDLHTIKTIIPIRQRDDLREWTPDSAWLAGGTWLFSEPQVHLSKLVDLSHVDWEPIVLDEQGLSLAATCTFAQLFSYQVPSDLPALELIAPSCRALLGSFKVWNAATVGGNICLALPAAPMIALTVALDGEALIWQPDGGERRLSVLDFVTGASTTALQGGELLRAIDMPRSALRRRIAHRRAALTPLGRSAVFLIGTRGDDGFALIVTGATRRPFRLHFTTMPTVTELKDKISGSIRDEDYHDDVHGRPAWRRHLTYLLSAEIRDELAGPS